jgi:hypothetical protein
MRALKELVLFPFVAVTVVFVVAVGVAAVVAHTFVREGNA